MKVRLIIRVIINWIRIPVLFLLTFGKLKFSVIELISPLCSLQVYKGKMYLGKKVSTEPNVLIKCTRGELKIGDGVYIIGTVC